MAVNVVQELRSSSVSDATPRARQVLARPCTHPVSQRDRRSRWDTGWVQGLASTCRARGVASLTELDLSSCTTFTAMVAREMLHDLRLAYFTPEASRDAGFIETDHFGVRFPERGSHFDLTGIGQRGLRDLLWAYLAGLLRSPSCPRTGGTFDPCARAA